MSRLQSSLYHDMDGGRTLEVQFTEDRLFVSISWETEASGIRAESFALEPDQAYYLAKDILERFPDPMILEDNLAAIS